MYNEKQINTKIQRIKNIKLNNGLNIIYFDDPNYASTYFSYNVKYGGKDYIYSKNNNIIETPVGIAHFLEHVMFKLKENDAFELFSQKGANINAYTSYSRTSFLFDIAKDEESAINLLFEMMNSLEINNEIIENEKKIIKEEIDMYKKDIYWQQYFQTMKFNLNNSNYKNSIIGEYKDISKITTELLNEVYSDYYNPNNCYLVIVGKKANLSVEYIKEKIKLKNSETKKIIKKTNNENFNDDEKEIKVIPNDNIQNKYYTISYKYQTNINENKLSEYRLLIKFIIESKYSIIDEQYNELIENKQLNYDFDADFLLDANFLMLTYSFNSLDLEQVEKIIDNKKIFKNIEYEKIKSLIIKEKAQFLKSFNNHSVLAEKIVKIIEEYNNIENYLNLLDSLNEKKVEKMIADLKIKEKRKKILIIE